MADKKRKARGLATIKIGSNLVNDLKKLKILTKQTPRAGPADDVNRHVFMNSAPLMFRGNGEAFAELHHRTSHASSSDLSRP